MQSKLPVRIKRKQAYPDKKTCCCAQLMKFMMDSSLDSGDQSFVQEGVSLESIVYEPNKVRSKTTQTDISEIYMDPEMSPYKEIKSLLVSIDCTLEQILHTLKDKKEYLYSKLQEETSANCKKSKVYCNKNKIEKNKKKILQLSKRSTYAWPEISRLYYGQTPWMRHYMHNFPYGVSPTNSNDSICPRQHSWIYTNKHNSCCNINYFQPMGKIFRRNPFSISVWSNPVITVRGKEDLDVKDNSDLEEVDKQQNMEES